MGLFGLGKKKEEENINRCCDGGGNTKSQEYAKTMNNNVGAIVKVLGSGCAKCNQLEENVKKALEQMGWDTTIDHVTDFSIIAAYGVMSTPALVVNEKVVSYGKVLKVEEAVNLLEKVSL